MQRQCGENKAAYEQTQGQLEKARTEHRELAMKVGSLLDDQRRATNAQAETGLVELHRLLAEMQLQQVRFDLEVSALREDLATRPNAKAIDELHDDDIMIEENIGLLQNALQEMQGQVERAQAAHDERMEQNQVLQRKVVLPAEAEAQLDKWKAEIDI